MTVAEKIPEIEFAEPIPDGAVSVPAVAEPAPLPAAQPSEGGAIFDLIARAARDPAVDIDKMERLIAMQERVQAKQAEVEFDNAMRDAQEEMKAIRADLSNDQTKSNYASYAQLDKAIRPIYTRHGFAVTFNTGDAPRPDDLRVLAIVSRGRHRQNYKIDVPADGKGAKGGDVMTRTHATGAAASYGQRYLYKLIFNLAVGDVDNDGNGASGDIEALAGPNAPRDANGKLLSTYEATKAQKAKEWANNAIEGLNLTPNKEMAKEWRREVCKAPPGKRVSPIAWLELHAPDQFARVKVAFQNVTGEDW